MKKPQKRLKSLESLFGSMPKSEFLDLYLKNTPVVNDGPIEALSEFTELPFYNL